MYRISIYHDYNGKLYVDEYFELEEECNRKYETPVQLLDDILIYEGDIDLRGECDLAPALRKEIVPLR